MAASDRVRLDIGFKGGATLTVEVVAAEADALEHVLYVRRHSRGSRVGFSAAT